MRGNTFKLPKIIVNYNNNKCRIAFNRLNQEIIVHKVAAIIRTQRLFKTQCLHTNHTHKYLYYKTDA